jgi:hypothetical protein
MVICGCAAIAVGILGKDFYQADVLSGAGFKEKSSKWSGRLVFIVGGLFFVAIGIKLMMDAR